MPPVTTVADGSARLIAAPASFSSVVYAAGSARGAQNIALLGSFQISHACTPIGA